MYPRLLSDPQLPLTMRISDASEDDDFNKLLNEIPMRKGALSIKTEIPSSLQDNLASDRRGFTIPILFEDQEGKKSGCASFSVWNLQALSRLGFTAGDENLRIGYFGDLRISPTCSRGVRIYWREVYRAWLQRLANREESGSVDAVLTSVLDENKLAIRALGSGRGEVFYKPIFSYVSVSILFDQGLSELQNEKPWTDSVAAESILQELQVNYEFRNPHRRWRVESEFGQPLQLCYFTLSKLVGLENLSENHKTKAWSALMHLAAAWSKHHQRPLFQFAKVGVADAVWDYRTDNEIQRWQSPATLYQVATRDDCIFPLQVLNAKYLDPSQL